MKSILVVLLIVVLGIVGWRLWKNRPAPIVLAPEVTVTIPEGFTNKEIAARVAKHTNVTAAEFEKAADGQQGYLFPDTYRIHASTTAGAVVRRMKENYDRKVPDGATRDILIMASILEGEVKHEDEMRKVADILFRRLRDGWPLQVDVAPETYKRRGPPAEPVNNPGLRAINAALNPTPNSYWFYLTGGDGVAHFARTLEEHNANKKYLK